MHRLDCDCLWADSSWMVAAHRMAERRTQGNSGWGLAGQDLDALLEESGRMANLHLAAGTNNKGQFLWLVVNL